MTEFYEPDFDGGDVFIPTIVGYDDYDDAADRLLDQYGDDSADAIIVALSKAVERRKIKKG